MSRPEERAGVPDNDNITARVRARSAYHARLSDKLAGMLAAAEAMGSGGNDAPLLNRLSIELSAIAATAAVHGFGSVAVRALEASRILVAGLGVDAACVRERIHELMAEFEKTVAA